MVAWLQRESLQGALLFSLLIAASPTHAGVPERWVDAGSGEDGNPGTELAPFATITHAISEAGPGAVIHVNPGQYDAALGESFPIFLLAGQRVLGDVPNRGQGTVATAIVGNGAYNSGYVLGQSATVVCGAGSEFSGFQIQAQTSGLGQTAIVIQGVTATASSNTCLTPGYASVFLDDAGTSRLENCRFETESYGVYVAACPEAPQIQGNIFGSSFIQLDVIGPDTNVQVSDNEFLAGSDVGIHVQNGQPRLTGNTFQIGCGTDHGGVFSNHALAEPILRSNVFLNALGVKITTGSPDLGVGVDPGQNDFTAVTGISLQHDGPADLSAIGNSWPHDPPILGVDIVLNGTGTVVTTGVPNRRDSVGGLKARF